MGQRSCSLVVLWSNPVTLDLDDFFVKFTPLFKLISKALKK